MSHSPSITDSITNIPAPHVAVHRLGALPIIRHFLRALRVREIIDGYSPKLNSEVSNGECVEAMVMALFLDKEHALSRVGGLLEGYDMATVFRPDVNASHFHDTRLGECLDDLYELAPTIYGDIVASAIQNFRLVIKRLNLDATKIKLYGDYACFEDYMAHVDTIAFPERGWNPEGRFDLKQLLLELVVSEEQIPLLFAVGDGNASETSEYLKIMRRLDTIKADLSKAVLVADSKLCAAATLIEAAQQELRIVTLVPETFSLQGTLIKEAADGDLPVLLETEDGDVYSGLSFRLPLLIDFENGEVTETKTVMWRYLVVHSAQKARLARERRAREAHDEREGLDRGTIKFGTEKLFACDADAKQEAESWVKRQKLAYHRVTCTPLPGVIRKGRGRPGKDGKTSGDREGWGITFAIEEIPTQVRKNDPEGMFVLLTTIRDARILSDTEVLEGYKGRNVAEMSFHWLKGDAAVAPMFLKLASRIQTMGFVFVVWMLVYALIQRELRKALKGLGGKCPHPDKRWTNRPTTRGVLDIMAHVSISRLIGPGGRLVEQVQFWNPEFDRVLELLGCPQLYRPNSWGATE